MKVALRLYLQCFQPSHSSHFMIGCHLVLKQITAGHFIIRLANHGVQEVGSGGKQTKQDYFTL